MFGMHSPFGGADTALWAALLGTLVFTSLLIWAEQRDSARGRLLSKPFASAGFIAVALLTHAQATTPGTVILAGLALSFVGDVCLISQGEGLFLAGLGSFLLGHVAYAVAFVLLAPDWSAVGVALVFCLPLAALVFLDLRRDLPADMKVPVVVYMVVITAMVALAVGAAAGGQAPQALAVAALAFYFSDIAVALERFRSGGFGVKAMGLPLYYGAQLLFALGAAALTTA